MLSLFAPWVDALHGTGNTVSEWWQRLRADEANRTTHGRSGHVWLVGAGPGDPDLITVRGMRLLQQADVVVHDRLVAPELLDYCRPDARRLYVGKRCGRHSVPQNEINALLVREALAGRQVVRLKGGDPFIFGRGGEELAELQRHGVAASVVPGITAAAGCAAATGIPLTHRDHAASVCLVTAHRRDGAPQTDWAALAADPKRTLVCYMGLSELGTITAQLTRHGLSAETPAALISEGTTARQKAARCTLATLAETAQQTQMGSPCLVMIGSVVSLGDARVFSQEIASTTDAVVA
ncbi:uroporphyrinogen-III C-methyltransferase [Alcanivorax sp. JB21]|uniref:uroporphyrinogen-III C-methyltransferase n=1 Tax=Alcanivorax limicola TaxID=2874102 RepID=UPI001CBAAFC8|nr:uroporphyrinogen-III C-methyltransferase [Alcanivorax limicola]MBZ2187787.1 uroporphyrinogen-III C-methyltransferase [Alcanivorax limicola]